MPDYKQVISQIKAFAPVYEHILNPGADSEEIDRFKQHAGVLLPENFLDFYETANGGKSYQTVDIGGMCFASLESIIRSKKMFDEILAEKQAENNFFCWHTDWLPFADDYSYDTLVIDTSGKASGQKGCILHRSKDSFKDDPITIISASFETFIQEWKQRVLNEKVYQKGATESDSENWAENYGLEEYAQTHVMPRF